MNRDIKPSKLDVIKHVREILASHCEDPAEQMIREGEAIVAIGNTLKGLSLTDARATLRAVAVLEGAE